MVGVIQAFMTKVYQHCWKELVGLCAQEGIPNNTISVPLLAGFFIHLFRVGLAWYIMDTYHSATSAFLRLHYHHKVLNNAIIYKSHHHKALNNLIIC